MYLNFLNFAIAVFWCQYTPFIRGMLLAQYRECFKVYKFKLTKEMFLNDN